MKRYAGIYLAGGEVRRLTFEAPDLAEAKELAVKWGVGVEGEAGPEPDAPAAPEAYDAKTACAMLGGISRTKLYQMRVCGILDALPDTRKVLITRASLEKYCRRGRS